MGQPSSPQQLPKPSPQFPPPVSIEKRALPPEDDLPPGSHGGGNRPFPQGARCWGEWSCRCLPVAVTHSWPGCAGLKYWAQTGVVSAAVDGSEVLLLKSLQAQRLPVPAREARHAEPPCQALTR